DALASRCFTTLAAVLSKQFTASPSHHSFSAWWSELAGTRGEDTMASVTAAPTADPTPPPPPPPPPPKIAAQAAPADDLPALVDRARALLADPALDVTAFERFLNPVIELYVSRF